MALTPKNYAFTAVSSLAATRLRLPDMNNICKKETVKRKKPNLHENIFALNIMQIMRD